MARDTGNRLNENDEYTYKPAQVRSSCLPLAVRIFSFFLSYPRLINIYRVYVSLWNIILDRVSIKYKVMRYLIII